MVPTMNKLTCQRSRTITVDSDDVSPRADLLMRRGLFPAPRPPASLLVSSSRAGATPAPTSPSPLFTFCTGVPHTPTGYPGAPFLVMCEHLALGELDTLTPGSLWRSHSRVPEAPYIRARDLSFSLSPCAVVSTRNKALLGGTRGPRTTVWAQAPDSPCLQPGFAAAFCSRTASTQG